MVISSLYTDEIEGPITHIRQGPNAIVLRSRHEACDRCEPDSVDECCLLLSQPALLNRENEGSEVPSWRKDGVYSKEEQADDELSCCRLDPTWRRLLKGRGSLVLLFALDRGVDGSLRPSAVVYEASSRADENTWEVKAEQGNRGKEFGATYELLSRCTILRLRRYSPVSQELDEVRHLCDPRRLLLSIALVLGSDLTVVHVPSKGSEVHRENHLHGCDLDGGQGNVAIGSNEVTVRAREEDG